MSELPTSVIKPPELPPPQTLVCANCHAELTGEYCARCGQRHETHIHTVAHFAGEALESISHADSRLWRTLWYLFRRPGFLTREFFAGRRVTYLPPFRLYLVLSVIFFLLNGLTSGGAENPEATGAARTKADPSAAQTLQEEQQQAIDTANEELRGAPLQVAQSGKKLHVRSPPLDEFCASFEGPEPGGSGAAARQNVRQFCRRIREDTSQLFTELGHNLPRAMFLFLPLLAGIMKLLYWRPKRYYVEHLLFLVHNHAFVFLLLICFSLIELGLEPLIGESTGLIYVAGFCYGAWYIYRGMRNMYAQNRWLTLSKYLFLGTTYLVTALVTLLLTLVILALVG